MSCLPWRWRSASFSTESSEGQPREVTSGRERVTGPGEQHAAGTGLSSQIAEQVTQRVVKFVIDGVARRTVDRRHENVAIELPPDHLTLHSIAVSTSSPMRSLPNVSNIRGDTMMCCVAVCTSRKQRPNELEV